MAAFEREEKERRMASYRPEHETMNSEGIPSLDDMEVGKPVGAILPMSEEAQVALRDSIELVDFLLNQESVTWN
jgi:hypothetical protein